MKSEKGIHDHHRERMRERVKCGGLSSFAEHELLEMMLYYSIPRGDTNELAHLLMNRFGGFNEIIEASVDELRDVKGIGESSAVLVKLMEEIIRRYVSLYSPEVTRYDTLLKVANYIWPRFLGLNRECLYMMLFNNKMAMIDCSLICEGTVNAAKLHPRVVLEKAFRKNAATAILAHNHPHGMSMPSEGDIALTKLLFEDLAMVGITLLEHIVVAENQFLPIIKYHPEVRRMRSREGGAPLIGALDLDIVDFYGVNEHTYRFEDVINPVLKGRT